MDRTAVFVDAGYVFAAGSQLVAGEKLHRSKLMLEFEGIRKLLVERAREITQQPLLRVYWYDGTSSGPTPQHLALAYQPDIKLRLGMVNNVGQQKGVDSLIVTDMINLARNRAIADAVLVSGDEDVRVGVQQAQEFGVRVHLLGIEPASGNQSNLLRQESDTVAELSKTDVHSFLSLRIEEKQAVAAEPSGSLEEVVRALASSMNDTEKEAVALTTVNGQVPPELDGRLLVAGAKALSVEKLSSTQKRQLRTLFLAACDATTDKPPR